MKRCLDCRHHRGETRAVICANPSVVHPVDGLLLEPSCEEARSTGTCGPEGRLFEGKEPAYPGAPRE